jgi:hypothetical protein
MFATRIRQSDIVAQVDSEIHSAPACLSVVAEQALCFEHELAELDVDDAILGLRPSLEVRLQSFQTQAKLGNVAALLD